MREGLRAAVGAVVAVAALLATAGLAGEVELPCGSGAGATIFGANDHAPPGPGDSSGYGGTVQVPSSAVPEEAEALPPPPTILLSRGFDSDGGIPPGHRDRIERPPRVRG